MPPQPLLFAAQMHPPVHRGDASPHCLLLLPVQKIAKVTLQIQISAYDFHIGHGCNTTVKGKHFMNSPVGHCSDVSAACGIAFCCLSGPVTMRCSRSRQSYGVPRVWKHSRCDTGSETCRTRDVIFQCHELKGTSGRAVFNAKRHNATSTAPTEYQRLLPVSRMEPRLCQADLRLT